jgi:hypothetical protein
MIKNQTKKDKQCRFSRMRIIGLNEKNKHAHFRVYLPFGEIPFSTYYESLI